MEAQLGVLKSIRFKYSSTFRTIERLGISTAMLTIIEVFRKGRLYQCSKQGIGVSRQVYGKGSAGSKAAL